MLQDLNLSRYVFTTCWSKTQCKKNSAHGVNFAKQSIATGVDDEETLNTSESQGKTIELENLFWSYTPTENKFAFEETGVRHGFSG